MHLETGECTLSPRIVCSETRENGARIEGIGSEWTFIHGEATAHDRTLFSFRDACWQNLGFGPGTGGSRLRQWGLERRRRRRPSRYGR